ncbi:hypothetical protein FO440_00445 [Mucilaginibacter corticis]|uniref:TFIIB-type zinc ribbon-containing protein n=1 Tax=Mucilaginibacter corticis TaxID=2597670 RepID=A0A556MRV7_9SPHI|nr:hypothetical protein [Mucilaginibacter corticis]TSJ42696.1 hypothetical protein FO440_00445 [Mucilaginibacter corticis]
MNRFQDENLGVSFFEHEIFVKCPKCEKRATIVKEDPSSYFSKRVLKCPNCFYSQVGRHQTFKVELKCHCSHCAAEINVSMKKVNEKKDSIAVRCLQCGNTDSYKPKNIPIEWFYKEIVEGKPTERYFGLPLWLSEGFRGESFWAYNYEHLAYLKKYISADLRERNDRTHWTLVEKLPNWIKAGKNREKLVKLITEIEKR